jgi:hypothetical protein
VPPETTVERYKHLMLVILEHLGHLDDLEQKVYENHFDSRSKIIAAVILTGIPIKALFNK